MNREKLKWRPEMTHIRKNEGECVAIAYTAVDALATCFAHNADIDALTAEQESPAPIPPADYVSREERDAEWEKALRETWEALGMRVEFEVFIGSTRCRILESKEKSPEERVTVGRKLDGWELYLDGVLLQDKLSTDICAYARIGLIAELKEAKHDT